MTAAAPTPGRQLKRHAIGRCLKCRARLTYCGRPFTAEIPCRMCLYINIYRQSQQPVSGRW